MKDITASSRITASLLAGALGDALGAPVEVLDIEDILIQFPPAGITALAPSRGLNAAITDDTQMTLAAAAALQVPTTTPLAALKEAFYEWYIAQAGSPTKTWSSIPAMSSRRGPGKSCLKGASSGQAVKGAVGCGGVMRAAPIGLAFADPLLAYELGRDQAYLTHDSPTAAIPAGITASTISQLVNGVPLPLALYLASGIASVTDPIRIRRLVEI